MCVGCWSGPRARARTHARSADSSWAGRRWSPEMLSVILTHQFFLGFVERRLFAKHLGDPVSADTPEKHSR